MSLNSYEWSMFSSATSDLEANTFEATVVNMFGYLRDVIQELDKRISVIEVSGSAQLQKRTA